MINLNEKYICDKEDYNTNNYDCYIDVQKIPPNLLNKDIRNMQRLVNTHTPLTKRIHLINDTSVGEYTDDLCFRTGIKVTNSETGRIRVKFR